MCVLMFMYYTVCYFTGIFYAVVWQISMLFIDNRDSVFCILCTSIDVPVHVCTPKIMVVCLCVLAG